MIPDNVGLRSSLQLPIDYILVCGNAVFITFRRIAFQKNLSYWALYPNLPTNKAAISFSYFNYHRAFWSTTEETVIQRNKRKLLKLKFPVKLFIVTVPGGIRVRVRQ